MNSIRSKFEFYLKPRCLVVTAKGDLLICTKCYLPAKQLRKRIVSSDLQIVSFRINLHKGN